MSSLVKLHILHHSTPPPPSSPLPRAAFLKKRERHTKNYNLFIGWLLPEKKKENKKEVIYCIYACKVRDELVAAENPETRLSVTQPGPHGVRFSLSFPFQPDSLNKS